MKSRDEIDRFLSLGEKNNGKIVKNPEKVSGYFQDIEDITGKLLTLIFGNLMNKIC